MVDRARLRMLESMMVRAAADDELSAGQVGWLRRTLQGGIPKATVAVHHHETDESIYWEGAEMTSRGRLPGEVWSCQS